MEGCRVIAPFDPFAPAFYESRYAAYRRYQEEDPFHWGVGGVPTRVGTWYVFGYDDIAAILRDTRFGKRSASPTAPVPEGHEILRDLTPRWMLLQDPPAHGRLRSLFQRAFHLCMGAGLVGRVERIAKDLAARLPRAEPFDLVSAFAGPLPVRVIGEVVGIPAERHADVQRWSRVMFDAIDLKNDAAKYRNAASAAREVTDLVGELMAQRRISPREDLISAVLCDPDSGEWSDEDLRANLAFFLFAGQETTVSLIGNGVLALLEQPRLWTELRQNPERVPSAVDEVLRFLSPVQATTRVALTEADVGGKRVHAGDLVCLMVGAGHRDPRRFSVPDRFDPVRRPNRHFGFGHGPHTCLGATLGTMEGQIALRTLLCVAPELRLEGGQPEWSDRFSFLTLRDLRVRLDPKG